MRLILRTLEGFTKCVDFTGNQPPLFYQVAKRRRFSIKDEMALAPTHQEIITFQLKKIEIEKYLATYDEVPS